MKRIRCSYTVEAAYIVPLCTLIVLLLVTEALFYRDIVTAEGIALQSADAAVRYMQHSAGPGEAAIDYSHLKKGVFAGVRGTHYSEADTICGYVESRLKGRLFVSNYAGVDVRIEGGSVRVELRIHARDEIRYLFQYLPRGMFIREIRVTEKSENLSETNRLWTAVWDTGTRIKGVSELLEKLEGFLASVTD